MSEETNNARLVKNACGFLQMIPFGSIADDQKRTRNASTDDGDRINERRQILHRIKSSDRSHYHSVAQTKLVPCAFASVASWTGSYIYAVIDHANTVGPKAFGDEMLLQIS